MDYNHITSFLEKFRKIIFQGEEINKVIIEIITKHISYPIESNKIKIKGDIIYVQGSPMLRNEVLMHKGVILLDLSQSIKDRHFGDIR